MRGTGRRLISMMLAAVMALLTGCGAGKTEDEGADTITVYMWSTQLYESYAPYIQSQLPDVNIEFVVGNNDLDYYKFLDEHGALPDIITCRRFSLHDAAGLKDHLMDLSTTEAAGAVYDSYLASFTNTDGTVNWLPLCAKVDGFVANRGLFERYNIPLPTDYESFVSACQAFEALGIRGFTADFAYDYTCMEILQGLSIPEITSMQGRLWRSGYEDPADMETLGLDKVIWPEAFRRMEQFIQDTKLGPADVELDYDPVIEMFNEGKVAIIRSSGANTVRFNEEGVDAVFLPYFGSGGEQGLLTYPQFQSKPMFMSDLRGTLLTAIGRQKEAGDSAPAGMQGSGSFQNKHLLLVEDNELNREIALEILGEYGFRIDTAENGVEGVKKVAASGQDGYDVVLMDVQMPIMDGYEATRRIRALKDPALREVPILAMTANAFNEDRKAAAECGMSGFLSKPIDIDELWRMLQSILGTENR